MSVLALPVPLIVRASPDDALIVTAPALLSVMLPFCSNLPVVPLNFANARFVLDDGPATSPIRANTIFVTPIVGWEVLVNMYRVPADTVPNETGTKKPGANCPAK